MRARFLIDVDDGVIYTTSKHGVNFEGGRQMRSEEEIRQQRRQIITLLEVKQKHINTSVITPANVRHLVANAEMIGKDKALLWVLGEIDDLFED